MANLLLLYDTKEEDLAKDFRDLLTELNAGNIIMIPLSPDKGLSLEEKERKNFSSANGAIFIITPGSERDGISYPSPSVNVEIGKALEQFKDKPECVVLLVDDRCKTATIVQKPHISFKRDNIRSILAALIQLVKDLKSAGLYRTTAIPSSSKPQSQPFDLKDFFQSLDNKLIQILFDISNEKDGFIIEDILTGRLINVHKLTMQQVNFLKRDLEASKTVMHIVTGAPNFWNYWMLNNLGWDVVKLELERKKKAEQEAIKSLAGLFLTKGLGPTLPGGSTVLGQRKKTTQ